MKSTYIAIGLSILLIGGAVVLTKVSQKETNTEVRTAEVLNVHIENGIQIVDLTARGGFTPNKSVAQAGIPTVIRFFTKNTFDCSASVRIPSMDISRALPSNGTTDIDIGTQPTGTFKGTCSMGMYPFEIAFN